MFCFRNLNSDTKYWSLIHRRANNWLFFQQIIYKKGMSSMSYRGIVFSIFFLRSKSRRKIDLDFTVKPNSPFWAYLCNVLLLPSSVLQQGEIVQLMSSSCFFFGWVNVVHSSFFPQLGLMRNTLIRLLFATFLCKSRPSALNCWKRFH